MSISALQNEITRLNKDLSDLDRKLAEETKKEHERIKKINDLQNSLSRATSSSALSSKLTEIARHQKDIADIQKRKSDLQKKKADTTDKIFKKTQQLNREEDSERKKFVEKQKRELASLTSLQSKYIAERKEIARLIPIEQASATVKYDFFISHASEDKEEIAKPLADILTKSGATVWYDEFSLKIGDSLRRNIDQGLANSKYGIVILSSNFFMKEWPQRELDGLTQKEIQGTKVILPIWHKISKDEVISFSPTLADKVALNTAINTVEEISSRLMELIL